MCSRIHWLQLHEWHQRVCIRPVCARNLCCKSSPNCCPSHACVHTHTHTHFTLTHALLFIWISILGVIQQLQLHMWDRLLWQRLWYRHFCGRPTWRWVHTWINARSFQNSILWKMAHTWLVVNSVQCKETFDIQVWSLEKSFLLNLKLALHGCTSATGNFI